MYDKAIKEAKEALQKMQEKNVECKAQAVVQRIREDCPETAGLSDDIILFLLHYTMDAWTLNADPCPAFLRMGIANMERIIKECQAGLSNVYDRKVERYAPKQETLLLEHITDTSKRLK